MSLIIFYLFPASLKGFRERAPFRDCPQTTKLTVIPVALMALLSNTLSMKVTYPEQMIPCYKFHPSDYLLELKLGPQLKQGDIEINKCDGKVFA